MGLDTEDPEYGAHFNSADSYVTYSPSLRYRQKISGKYVQNARLPFLYPESWDGTGATKTDYGNFGLQQNPETGRDRPRNNAYVNDSLKVFSKLNVGRFPNSTFEITKTIDDSIHEGRLR